MGLIHLGKSVHFNFMIATCVTSCVSSTCSMRVDLSHNNNMDRAKDSVVWMHVLPTSSTAIYNICKGHVMRGGDSTAKYKRTNLIKHQV